MQNYKNIDFVFTPAQKTAIDGGFTTVKDNIPVKINLTKQDKAEMKTISIERMPFVNRTVKDFAVKYPNLVSGFKGTLQEAENDLSVFIDLTGMITEAEKILEFLIDLRHAVGAELYQWELEYYNSAKRAALGNVPGADVVVDFLKVLFEDQGRNTPNVQ